MQGGFGKISARVLWIIIYLDISIGEREGERSDRSHLGRELGVHERRWCRRSTKMRRGRSRRLERERRRCLLLRLRLLREGGYGVRRSREEGWGAECGSKWGGWGSTEARRRCWITEHFYRFLGELERRCQRKGGTRQESGICRGEGSSSSDNVVCVVFCFLSQSRYTCEKSGPLVKWAL